MCRLLFEVSKHDVPAFDVRSAVGQRKTQTRIADGEPLQAGVRKRDHRLSVRTSDTHFNSLAAEGAKYECAVEWGRGISDRLASLSVIEVTEDLYVRRCIALRHFTPVHLRCRNQGM